MKDYRSLCPLARSLDIFGDKWTLLILRDVAMFGKSTFKDLVNMPEGIATNTLSDRLEKLVKLGMLVKTKSSRNKLVFHYRITEKGLDLIPVVQSILNWAEKYLYQESEKEDFQEFKKSINFN